MLCEGIITSPGERRDINFKIQECDMITGNETNNGGRDFYREDIPHSILTRSKSTPLLLLTFYRSKYNWVREGSRPVRALSLDLHRFSN